MSVNVKNKRYFFSIDFISALAGSPEARVPADQGRVPRDPLPGGEVLRGRPLQAGRGDHQGCGRLGEVHPNLHAEIAYHL